MTEHQHQASMHRVHSLLIHAHLDNEEVKTTITNLVKARLKFKGQLSPVPPMLFLHELVNIMIELDNRGISLGHPAQTEAKLSNNLETANFLAENYSETQKIDRHFGVFLESRKCPKWDMQKPLYRGGNYRFEAKIPRNALKGKMPYKPGAININRELYGSGLYVTDNPQEAKSYGDRATSSGFIKLMLRANVPLIDYNENETLLRHTLRLNKDALEYYLFNLCLHPVLLRHDRGTAMACYFTIKSPAIIKQIHISDNIDCHHTSINQINPAVNTTKGNPTEFKRVRIPDGAKMSKVDEAMVIGSSLCARAQVWTFKDALNNPEYVVKSPIDDNIYWLLAPIPHSRGVFALEPHPDFLLNRHSKKLTASTHNEWPESRPAINQLWEAFQKN